MPVQRTTAATIATLVQSQNFATLLAAMNGAGLAAGKTVEARLLTLDGDGAATALVDGVKVSLLLAGPEARQAALQPGASLLLKLEASAQPGAPLQATLVGTRPAPADAPAPPPGLAQGAPAPARDGGAALQAGPGGSASAQATGAAPLAASAPRQGAPGVAAQPAASPRSVAGPLLGAAIGRQDSLAPLFANLGGLAQGSVALTLPKPLLTLVDQILAQRLPAEGKPLTGEALKGAVARSGLFLEAGQAAGAPPAPQTDLKAGLQALRDMLRPAVQAAPQGEIPPGPEPAAPPSARPAAQVATASAPLDARPAAPRAGLLTPQPAQEASLTPAVRPAAIAQTLFEQAEAGLDRIALAQYASLPAEPVRHDAQTQARWLTEIPLALHNGTAILPLEIERDPPQAGSATLDAPIWRVRFALDAEPLGPLQGMVTLQGRAIAVSFWAEREETSRLLRQASPDLEASLVQGRFESAELEVFTGHPRQARAAPGQFLDRRS